MKRRDLVNHLLRHGCVLIREGGHHSIFLNSETNQTSTVPRHNEIDSFLSRKICRDLGVPILKRK